MSFPRRSVLMGAGQDDAWFLVGRGQAPLLLSTNGASIINGIQHQLINIIVRAGGRFGSSDEWLSQMGGWNGNSWTAQTGRWDAVTARATMILADGSSIKQTEPKTVSQGWGEYYSHRFGPALTRLALHLWITNDQDLDFEIAHADVSVPSAETNYSVIIPNDAILPRWNTRPAGLPSPITVRQLSDAELEANGLWYAKPGDSSDAGLTPEQKAAIGLWGER